MQINKQVPIVTTSKLKALKAFYTQHLGFKVLLDVEEYLGLTSADGRLEVGFMAPGEGCTEYAGRGLTLALEVPNADAEHARLSGTGLRVTRSLQDNPWGDRSFVVQDPVGVSVYIHHPIAPTGNYAAPS